MIDRSSFHTWSLRLKMKFFLLPVVLVLVAKDGRGSELVFPKGASFVTAVSLASNLPKGPTDGLVHFLEMDLSFSLPDEIHIGKKKSPEYEDWYKHKLGHKRWKRNVKEEQRRDLLLKIENLMDRVGLDGSSCILRFQCELKNVILEDSLLGHILSVVFKVEREPNAFECRENVGICPVSLLQAVLHSEQVSSFHVF